VGLPTAAQRESPRPVRPGQHIVAVTRPFQFLVRIIAFYLHVPIVPNVALHLPPTLARLTPKTRAYAFSERAHTRAEGGQVEAVVGQAFSR
jgi:hypothetical protein